MFKDIFLGSGGKRVFCCPEQKESFTISSNFMQIFEISPPLLRNSLVALFESSHVLVSMVGCRVLQVGFFRLMKAD